MNPRLSLIVIIFTLIKLASCVPIEITESSSETELSTSSSSSSSPSPSTHESSTSSSVSSSSSSFSPSHPHSSSASISAAHERTLLITQKWLIDNINLLRREMNEMARDYNQHIDANKQEAIRKEVEFVRDVDTLRADHTLLARNQLQIINLIKNQQQSVTITNSNENENNSNNIESTSDSSTNQHHHRKHLRHLVYDLIKEEANFENETKHNLSSLTTQLTDLHQVTISLYRDLKELKKRIQSVDFN